MVPAGQKAKRPYSPNLQKQFIIITTQVPAFYILFRNGDNYRRKIFFQEIIGSQLVENIKFNLMRKLVDLCTYFIFIIF